MNNSTNKTAKQLHKLGINIIPVRTDGSRRPVLQGWNQYMDAMCTQDEITKWFARDAPYAIGLICGQISGNLECIDIDDASLIEPFEELAQTANLMKSLVIVETGSGKRHYYYRCASNPGKRKLLAQNPPENGKPNGKVAIELRANGCMTIGPGSPIKTHPSGKPYHRISERTFKELITFSEDDRRKIHRICQSLTRWVSNVGSEFSGSVADSKLDPSRPGDDFNVNGVWGRDILEPVNFTLVQESGDQQFWKRPDGESAWSVSTGIKSRNGRELMRVFSTNCEYFEADRSYDKFGAYAAIHHGRDPNAAAAALKKLGYGTETSVTATDGDRIVIQRFSTIPSRKINWVWKSRIPIGKLTVLSGDPGIGKSFSFCDLAARISTGRDFPDGAPCQLGEVLIFSSEDDPGDTLAPRLRAHEADLDRIHFLTVESSEGGFQQFDIITHLSELDGSMTRQPDARLLVLDPLTAYMGDIDSNSNTDVRRVLGPLCEMAQKHQVAVLGVSHLTKKDTRAVARTLGSMAFVAASRANWIITRDKEDRQRRLFLQAKNNLADAAGLAFRIENDVVKWEEDPIYDDVDQATQQPKTTHLERAEALLERELQDAPVACQELINKARVGNISETTLRRAKKSLGVKHEQRGDHFVWFFGEDESVDQTVNDLVK